MRVNEQIRSREVRLIGAQGEQVGVVSRDVALRAAQNEDLDLVEVSPQAVPPVCRIMDYSKYKYEQEKKDREAKKKQHVTHLKELRLKPKIAEHDYLVKLKQLIGFLQDHDKVKVRMIYRGREMTHMEFGRQILDRMVQDVAAVGELERPPLQEGRNIILVFKPK
ncbi:MAG: translation initiation factor IF-3 [Candidatus Omnitrophica bacterium]|nr:translation initiation factor IF-3 [Candidatus Omnitrophota bacterium]